MHKKKSITSRENCTEKQKAPERDRSGVGASDLTRTGDLLITSEMHYRLCYTSICSNIIPGKRGNVNRKIRVYFGEAGRKKKIKKYKNKA